VKVQDEFIEEQIEEEEWKTSKDAEERECRFKILMNDLHGVDTLLGVAEQDGDFSIVQFGIDNSLSGFVHAVGMIDVLKSETQRAMNLRFLRKHQGNPSNKIDDILCAQICKNQVLS